MASGFCRIDSRSGGGQVIYGVTEVFKVNQAIENFKRRRSGAIIHLGPAKPQLGSVVALFNAVISGTRMDTGEFLYTDSSGTLTIQNVSGVCGIQEDDVQGYAIPISFVPNSDRAKCSNIYPRTTFID